MARRRALSAHRPRAAPPDGSHRLRARWKEFCLRQRAAGWYGIHPLSPGLRCGLSGVTIEPRPRRLEMRGTPPTLAGEGRRGGGRGTVSSLDLAPALGATTPTPTPPPQAWEGGDCFMAMRREALPSP